MTSPVVENVPEKDDSQLHFDSVLPFEQPNVKPLADAQWSGMFFFWGFFFLVCEDSNGYVTGRVGE